MNRIITPIMADLESVVIRPLAGNTPNPIGRGEMICVIFQVPLLNPDGTAQPLAVLVGNATNQAWYLLPGAESPPFYAEDQKDIYIRGFNPTLQNGVAELREFAVDAGAGYTIGDVLTLTGGDGNATITVTNVTGGGGVSAWTLTDPGTGYSANETTGVSGGTGADAEFLILSIVDTVQIVGLLYRRRKGGKQ